MGDTHDREAVLAAIRKRLDDMGRSQSWLGAEVARLEGRAEPYSQSAVNLWLSGKSELSPTQVFALERVLQLRPGSLSRRLGYLPVTARSFTSVRDAVEHDPGLGPVGRRVLLAAYEELVDHGPDGS